ncbi:class C beta-lactamase-related serine hydrolase [Bacillus clarus]|uniref:Beta-lactamase family protein n=1 Tax=Bacillus clarus TaxID=2338372 RepID=A0A090YME7_9BACI|nr:serine hydrolase [Bacillus clarus]KFM99421.1 beta-lactamase family protein [Bacillus clarus]RFT64948.1 class C beta-lactamase-related serine hydrolase [Bacillus clarus]
MNFEQLENKFEKKKVNTFLVYQRGELTTAYYKTTECANNLYKINSITKSIVSILIGIAIDKGYINDIHTSITTWIPNVPEEKKGLTLYHLLTMTTGEDWKEFGNGVVFPNDFVESDDWVTYILQKPIIEEMGTKMNYNSGSSHLLSYIIQVATGISAEQFAEKYLFEPLHITEYEWKQDPQGIYVGGFGMKMKSTDLLKLGQLCLQNGFWNGKKIVSQKWLEDSSKARFETYDHVGAYGYHWWVVNNERFHIPYYIYFAMGYGGQYIIIIPKLELVAVISSHMPKRGLVPLKLFIEHVQVNSNNI